ncbi:MAG: hypothetical protein Q8Q40_10500 [Methylococcaceae bacterium]|nr:hypothetical protein [Methylococcaceae bacterium]MDP3904390.1 hypothetical protein [Methylococcaceae bacterium]
MSLPTTSFQLGLKVEDEQFLKDMVTQLDETIRKLVVEEKELINKIGTARVEELIEFWKQELPEEEEHFFKMTLDYWDKILIRNWARSKRLHHTRAEVGRTFMKLNSNRGIDSKHE